MRIVADENIPYVREAFAGLGDVVTCSGRAMDAAQVKDADMLLVRSVTKVGSDLLNGSMVRFVATATIGEDHIDRPYLEKHDITFASAPGSNANSVGEYIAATLLVLADWRGFKIANKTLGIIGHGNVGKRVEAKVRALGMPYILNDPPLQRRTGDDTYRPLAELLEQSDIITTHVPLTKEGPDATYHLMNRDFFERVKTGVIIMNTARGAVANGDDLRAALESGKVGASVLDVWENEPNIDLNLFANLALGTPHIAGYSFDGKVNGTRQIYEAACAFLGVEPDWNPAPLLPAPDHPEIRVDGAANTMGAVRAAVLTVYDIREDDKALREIITMPPANRGIWFDSLRKNYPRRREFHNSRVIVDPADGETQRILADLGFRVDGIPNGSMA